MDEQHTLVYDASDKILGRLASHVASQMLTARKSGKQQRVIIVNAENAIVSGPKKRVFGKYRAKYMSLITLVRGLSIQECQTRFSRELSEECYRTRRIAVEGTL